MPLVGSILNDVETVDQIRRRLELSKYLPECVDRSNSAARRWISDVTTLLAEIDRLDAAAEHASGNHDH